MESFETGEPLWSKDDPDRLTQVLDNIIGNAISYAGRDASVIVHIDDGDPVRITISDTGVGIPACDLPHILNSFYRVNAARTPGEDHMGLGLSIARKMVEGHGGKLLISSTVGKGTTATILIPKDL